VKALQERTREGKTHNENPVKRERKSIDPASMSGRTTLVGNQMKSLNT